MRSQLCLAARAVIRDSATNAVSVFQLLDNISPQALPLVLPDASVLAVWEREEGDPDLINLEFTTHNNGTQVNATQVIVDWPTTTVNRFIINLAGLVISEPGQMSFTFKRDGNVLANYSFRVAAPPAQVIQPEYRELFAAAQDVVRNHAGDQAEHARGTSAAVDGSTQA
jgi:hypothetical protein